MASKSTRPSSREILHCRDLSGAPVWLPTTGYKVRPPTEGGVYLSDSITGVDLATGSHASPGYSSKASDSTSLMRRPSMNPIYRMMGIARRGRYTAALVYLARPVAMSRGRIGLGRSMLIAPASRERAGLTRSRSAGLSWISGSMRWRENRLARLGEVTADMRLDECLDRVRLDAEVGRDQGGDPGWPIGPMHPVPRGQAGTRVLSRAPGRRVRPSCAAAGAARDGPWRFRAQCAPGRR